MTHSPHKPHSIFCMENLLKSIQPNQPKEIADKITELLNVKGKEK